MVDVLAPFSPVYLEHLRCPRHLAPLEGPDFVPHGTGRLAGAALGTYLELSFRLNPVGHISHMAWRGLGTPALVPGASALAEWCLEGEGLPLDQALAITPEQLAQRLGGLPAPRIRTSLRAPQALRLAVTDFFRRLTRGPAGLSAEAEGELPLEGLSPGLLPLAHRLAALVQARGSYSEALELADMACTVPIVARAFSLWLHELGGGWVGALLDGPGGVSSEGASEPREGAAEVSREGGAL